MLNKTYADLKMSIRTWLNRDDPEVLTAIPSFIELAEQEFSRSVKIPMDEGQMLYTALGTGTLAEGVPIPDDMLSPIGVSIVTPSTTTIVSATRVDGFALFELLGKGEDSATHYFAKYENNFLFYPALKEDDIVSIAYHKDLTPMVADSDTSPALQYGYDLMLYWSLKHASVFLRDQEQEQFWTVKAQEALFTMEQTFDELHWGGSPLVILNV